MDDRAVLKSSINKIGFALITQALILACSLVTSLVVPKFMGTTQYGYWQIYYFYLNYINFVTLGYNDGLVLKYGGKQREELPIERIRSGNIIMCLISVGVAAFGLGIVNLLNISGDSKYIYSMLFLSMPFVCVFNIVLSFFLAINRQEVYNKVSFYNRFFTTIGYCALLFAGAIGYKLMIAIDYGIRVGFGVFCVAIGIFYFIGKRSSWKVGFEEVKENCGNGIFITGGALLASFMPMAGRVVLEKSATIELYALFSFALSVLALIVTFTNAAGMVFFPILKQLDKKQLLDYYPKIETIYSYLITVGLGMYFPAVFVIEYYLTDYRGVLEYMYLIFALCIPLGKMQMIITPYMKAYRMERHYFVANGIGAVAILGGTSLVYRITDSVYMVALVTFLLFEIWNLILELHLKHKLDIHSKANIAVELALIAAFLLSIMLGGIKLFAVMYVFAVMVVAVRFLKLRRAGKRS